MRNSVYLLITVVGLYLVLGFGVQLIYGPSYQFLSGEDCWRPDGQGGWVEHGQPSDPMPAEPSREVPLPVQYVPIFVPGLVLVAFLFTPLSKKLQPPKQPADLAEAEGDVNQGAEPPPEKT